MRGNSGIRTRSIPVRKYNVSSNRNSKWRHAGGSLRGISSSSCIKRVSSNGFTRPSGLRPKLRFRLHLAILFGTNSSPDTVNPITPPLAGSSKPNLRADCSHFLPSSEHLKVADIRPDTRFRWTANHSQAVPSTNMTHAGPRPPIPGRPPVPLVPRDLTDFDARHGGTLLPLTRLPAFSLNEGMPQTHQPQATINRGEPDK